MRNLAGKLALLSLISACALTTVNAQDAAAVPTFKQVFLNQLNDTEKKLVSLAEAFPQEKLAWRPAEGVRSAGEAFMHEAGANVFFMTAFGAKPYAGFDPKGEKTVTEKAKIVQALKDSFAHVRDTVSKLSDEDMMKPTKMMGRPLNYESALFVYANHLHEHLGQLIAYARSNGVVPPWSKGKDS